MRWRVLIDRMRWRMLPMRWNVLIDRMRWRMLPMRWNVLIDSEPQGGTNEVKADGNER